MFAFPLKRDIATAACLSWTRNSFYADQFTDQERKQGKPEYVLMPIAYGHLLKKQPVI